MAYKFQLGAARMSGSLTQEEGVTVDTGGLTVTAGGLTVTAGGATVTAGGLTVSAGTTAVQGLTAASTATIEGIVSGAAGTFDALAGTSLALQKGGITAAGAIAGATTIDASGDLTVGSITNTNFTVSSAGVVTAASTATIEGIVSGAAGTFDTLAGTSLALQKGGITAAGAIAGVSALTATANLDIGAYNMRAATLTADGLTSGRVVFAGTAGVLSDDSDFSFATDTLTVTKLGAYEQAGAVNFSDEAMTSVNIDSGVIDNTIIGASTAASGTFSVVKASTSVRPATLGGADLGEEGIGWGDVYIADNKKIYFGNGKDAHANYKSADDELQFGGVKIAFTPNVTFDGNMSLGASTAQTISILGNSTFENTTIADLGTVTTCEINGGSMDGVTVGANTPENGTFSALVGSTVQSNGALTVAGLTSLNGSTDVGDAVGDTCTFTARIDSNFVPSSDGARDLGTTGLRWGTLYVDSIVGPNIAWDVVTCDGGDTISASAEVAFVRVGNNVTVTLPAVSAGKNVRIKLSSSVGDVVIAASGSNMVENGANIRLESTGSAVTLIGIDNQNWFVI